MRTVLAVTFAIVAVALGARGAAPSLTVFRVANAIVSHCDDSLRSLSPGSWVRLHDCGVDMFHVAFLEDADATRTHRLVPLRPPWASATEAGTLALAIPSAAAIDPRVFRTRTRADSAL